MTAPTVVLLVAGLVTPPGVTTKPVGVRTDTATWVAKRRKKRRKPATPPAVRLETDLSRVEIKSKKRRATGILVGPGQELKLDLDGPGKLGVIVYQALSGGVRTAKTAVIVNTFLDGEARRGISYKGKRDRRAKVFGPSSPPITKPKGATVKIPAGVHAVEIQVPAASTPAVVELQYYPAGFETYAPLDIVPPPDEMGPVAGAPAAPPPVGPPPPALGGPPPVEEPPMPAMLAAEPVDAAADPAAALEARVRAGEMRDALVGAYDTLSIREQGAPMGEAFSKATLDTPFTFIVDGPGTVTLRVHRLIGTDSSSGDIQLTVLENDVLLQSLDVDAQVAARHSIVGSAALQPGTPKEYKLKLGQKLSRFVIQLSENAVDGVAMRYSFEPAEKSSAMALTLDLGDELGMGAADLTGGTVLTEVALREKVVEVKVEVEKVVRVGGDEFLGIAAGGDLIAPQARIAPAFGGGVELRLSLPFADRMFSLSIASSFLQQQLEANTADPRGAQLETRTGIMLIPITAGLVVRFVVSEIFGFYGNAGGGVIFSRGSSAVGGASHTASAWLPAARGGGGIEVKLGPGWAALELAYLYAVPADLDHVMNEYTPTGAQAGLKYRLGF
jgi:hypothetical protein